jgi:DNA invertase Pin-like site-specific DNA recombinase
MREDRGKLRWNCEFRLRSYLGEIRPQGLAFGIFAALVEFERELVLERTRASLAAARQKVGKAGANRK